MHEYRQNNVYLYMGIPFDKPYGHLCLFFCMEETKMTFESLVIIFAFITGAVAVYLVFFRMQQ